MKRKLIAKTQGLEKMLLQGLASGKSQVMTRKKLTKLRKEAKKLLK